MPSPALIEIYEDRIARLEEGVTDCKVDLGVVKTQIADGVQMLSDKLDLVAALSDRVTALETRAEIAKGVHDREESAYVKRHEHRARNFKIAAAIGSGLVAIVGLILKILLGA